MSFVTFNEENCHSNSAAKLPGGGRRHNGDAVIKCKRLQTWASLIMLHDVVIP